MARFKRDGLTVHQTLFAVPMTCESCVKDISGSLYKLDGISKVEANLKDQLVSIIGTGSHFMQNMKYTARLSKTLY